MNKGILAFMALLAVILIGVGVWTATPMGGGGLGEEGGAGNTVRDEEQGQLPGVVPQDRDGVAQDSSEGRVEIIDGRFEPSTVEVIGRSNVTFINRDDVAHGVDFEDESIPDRERIPPGRSYVVEMPETGRFTYTDPTSPGVEGTVVVTRP